MNNVLAGSFRIFRVAGIDVFLHWSWLLVALIEFRQRLGAYSTPLWNVLEYLSLFGIVLLHEFGHALACRSVGGKADKILLWPLGGVAIVEPPQRPGAMLWSTAAGPLVNVVLAPVLLLAMRGCAMAGLFDISADLLQFISAMFIINISLLIFNILPIYPLDGGQILRELLWFVFGRGGSLLAAVIVGFGGVAVMISYAVAIGSYWMGILAALVLMSCWRGLQDAITLIRLSRMPRRDGYSCPSCANAPVKGPYWLCSTCGKTFDTFDTLATCPGCGARFDTTRCPDCGSSNAISSWQRAVT